MKRSALLVLAGGILAAAAFFLPLELSHTQDGVFSSGISWLQNVQMIGLPAGAVYLLEPFAAILLILGGALAFKMRSAGHVLGLSGAAVGLTFLVWYFTLIYAVFRGFQPDGSFGTFAQSFGSGFWLAVIGCALGLIGSLLGWQKPQSLAAGASRSRVGIALALLGGLAAVASFFMAPFAPELLGQEGLFDLIKQTNGYLLVWPALLAPLLLIVCALFALRGTGRADLGSLTGALVGLTFLFLVVALSLGGGGARPFYQARVEAGYWLALLGYAAGFCGALVGLAKRSAAPAYVHPSEAPTQY
ncbi:MAG TPA: hypothetical protein VFU69_16025 [Ktedonobacterales bacterium]|nr:hypothetical protein [Ktedonobacterales bacterium]